jgi:hypothetical protein
MRQMAADDCRWTRRTRALRAVILAFCLGCARFAAAADGDLQALLGPEKRVRDSVSFTTEKGEAAALVLYVTEVEAVGGTGDDEIAQPLGCPEQVAGIRLTGVYHVALVIDGKLINELTVSNPAGGADDRIALPLRNLPYYNYLHWGQGTAVEYDAAVKRTEPTKLLRLADFNGDGRAWEFRLVQPGGACGHLNTLVAGYSAARRAVVVFPILSGPFRSDWADNLFPNPTLGAGTALESTFPCADHGNEKEVWQEYAYDAGREAWVLRRHRERDCDAAGKSAQGSVEPLRSPIAITIGSAAGAPGESVSIEVSIDTQDTPVGRVDHAIVVDPRVSVAAIEGLDFAGATSQWNAADDGIGPVHCTSEMVDTCEWAFSMRLDGDFVGRVQLYALKLKIPPDAAPGSYRLRNTDLAAFDKSGKELPVNGTDGELLVRAASTK